MHKSIHIRPAIFEDMHALARIHIKSWKQAYEGQVPQDYLNSLDVEERQKKWEGIFASRSDADRNIYLAFDGEKPVGFVAFGKARDEAMSGWGEIYAIYLLREDWGRSAGYSLFQVAREKFSVMGFPGLYLWVLDTNKQAISAYERWGGKVDYSMMKDDFIGDAPIKEIAVKFPL